MARTRGSRYIAVCGASEATKTQLDAAREVGRLLAESGAIVINGGLGGVSGLDAVKTPAEAVKRALEN
jgi:predicted Rossmann-fold nucleotide-binding protein